MVKKMKGISAIVMLVALLAILGVALFGIVTYRLAVPAVVPAVKYDGVWKQVGMSISNLESPWKAQDFDEINAVVFSDEDQVTAGNATLQLENGTTVDTEYTAYIYLEIDGTPRVATFDWEWDTSGNVSEDNVKIDEAVIYDYDDPTVEIATLDTNALNNEDKVTVTGLKDGEYILKLTFRFYSVTTPSAEGTRDTIGYLSGELDSPDAPDDEPTEFEDFKFDVLTV